MSLADGGACDCSLVFGLDSEFDVRGVTSVELANSIRDAGHKNVCYYRSMQQAIEFLLREARPGDAIMTIGAGNVSRASGELMVLLGTELRVPDEVKDAH